MRSCTVCGRAMPPHLRDAFVCDECETEDAWGAHADEKLVITRDDVLRAERRQARRDPAGVSFRMLLVWILPAAGLLLGVLAARIGLTLYVPLSIRPLAELSELVQNAAARTAWLGAAAMVIGIVAVIVIRQSRYFRSAPPLAAALSGLVSGAVFLVIGLGFYVPAASGFGWAHEEMPPPPGYLPPVLDVLRSTAVVLAPGAGGDARNAAIGAGAIISSRPDRAFVLTCSHVAMPYAAVSTARDPDRAHPVWVYFSDGRNAKGRVVWTAPPPLDAAVILVEIDDPPPAIPVRASADGVAAGDEVFFVANPFRAGWRHQTGRVLRRERHETPAGPVGLIFTSLTVLPGDSGTGLFLADGRLIGLNTWRSEEPSGPVAIGLPLEAVQSILDLPGSRETIGVEDQSGEEPR